MNTNPPPVGLASGAVSRRPTRARRSATVAGHPQHHSTSIVAGTDYIDNTPHIAGSTTCLCSLCHLKPRLFPRTQYGQILLPDPTKPDATTRFSTPVVPPRSHTASATIATAAVPGAFSRVMHEERGGPTPRPVQIDMGEGTSIGFVQLAGPGVPAGVRDDWTRLPPPLQHFEGSDPTSTEYATPRISHFQRNRSRTTTGRVRPAIRDSKPYDFKSKRTEPGPRIPGGVERIELDSGTRSSNEMPSASQVYPSHQSAPSSSSKNSTVSRSPASPGPSALTTNPFTCYSVRTRRQSWPDPYEDLGAEKFSQFMGPPSQLAHRELNLSGSSTLSQPQSFSSGEMQATSSTTFHHIVNTSPPNLPHPSFSLQESTMPPIQPQLPYQFQFSASNFEQSPQIITFNSRAENPQSTVWNPSDLPDQELVEDNIPQDGPSTQQMQNLRFQNPVTPDTHVSNPDRPRPISIIQVKWDSERKRRQGYFAQGEGEEKSPFRHYNKTGCDFDG